jgi:hypothetical protein
VCYIINDLLNRELIKQNFRFKIPVIPEDDEFEESKEELIHNDSSLSQQVLDSHRQSLREYFKEWDKFGIEEQLHKNTNQEAAFAEEENEMILPSVDPSEWYKEYERVKAYIEKDLDSQGNVVDSRKSMAK